MTEEQAWEQLYGRRSPDVRVLGSDAPGEVAADAAEQGRKARSAAQDEGRPESEAHAA
jgi:hypothetical protein